MLKTVDRHPVIPSFYYFSLYTCFFLTSFNSWFFTKVGVTNFIGFSRLLSFLGLSNILLMSGPHRSLFQTLENLSKCTNYNWHIHNFFIPLARSKYSSIFFVFHFHSIVWRISKIRLTTSYCLLINTRSGFLVVIGQFVGISNYYWSFESLSHQR